ISAGWGDRIFTACAMDMHYLGFDPNVALRFGHNELIDMVGGLDSKGKPKQKIIYEPFERSEELITEYVKSNGLFDICMTSPPFYIIERYNGENQSTASYPEFKQWMVKFLFKSLNIAWKNLNENGYLAINISNIRD